MTTAPVTYCQGLEVECLKSLASHQKQSEYFYFRLSSMPELNLSEENIIAENIVIILRIASYRKLVVLRFVTNFRSTEILELSYLVNF